MIFSILKVKSKLDRANFDIQKKQNIEKLIKQTPKRGETNLKNFQKFMSSKMKQIESKSLDSFNQQDLI